MRFSVISVVTLFVLSVALSSQAYAHKVSMFAYYEDGKVSVEGYFADGKKAQESEVEVFDSEGNKILSGKTGAEGLFVFTPPAVESLRITLDAGLGHKTEYRLDLDDIGEENIPNTDAPESGAGAAAGLQGVDAKALQEMIKKAVREANKPLIKSIEDAQQKATLGDIIGGIGFIFGILGIALYFQARKKFKE